MLSELRRNAVRIEKMLGRFVFFDDLLGANQSNLVLMECWRTLRELVSNKHSYCEYRPEVGRMTG
jgi:hypothetical protein